jgi:hypothetical protein
MKQLNQKQAIAFHDKGEWKEWSDYKIAVFQFEQELLCVPINRFKEALSNLLGRPVYTHDLISDEFKREFYSKIVGSKAK